jgi:hypothetical protein
MRNSLSPWGAGVSRWPRAPGAERRQGAMNADPSDEIRAELQTAIARIEHYARGTGHAERPCRFLVAGACGGVVPVFARSMLRPF